MNTRHEGFSPTTRKITGPGASAIKYDVLTALLVTAARGDGVEARLALRLSLLITARFNWRTGTFAVGQREMARMWGVTERTAKREMAEMRARGWITVTVPAARGRVAQHRIDLDRVLRATMPHWDAVGPDFASRMVNAPEPEGQGGNVVPLHREATPSPTDDGTVWSAAAARLHAQGGAFYGNWIAPLRPIDQDAGVMTLHAPTRFIASYVQTHFLPRVLAALAAEDPSIRDVKIVADG
ncbi:MAG: hypothetical protein KDK11_01475 [Maritimibacter sp.]|nr:hypothetical protein [Maritimibacter sp.]